MTVHFSSLCSDAPGHSTPLLFVNFVKVLLEQMNIEWSNTSAVIPGLFVPSCSLSSLLNIMPPDPNHLPTSFFPLHSSMLMSDSKWTSVYSYASVFMCPKGSGLVARTMGPPTAFCSDALSPKPSSKHHGKTIKTFSKSLSPSFPFSSSLSFYLSLHPPIPNLSTSAPQTSLKLEFLLELRQVFIFISFSTWDVSCRRCNRGPLFQDTIDWRLCVWMLVIFCLRGTWTGTKIYW